MNIRSLASFCPGLLVAVACHDSPPPAQPAGGEETELNRVHREVKENLGEAAGKAESAASSAQKELRKGAGKAGAELGVRPGVVDRPARGDAGVR